MHWALRLLILLGVLGPAYPGEAQQLPPLTIVTGQVTVTTTATLIELNRGNRSNVAIANGTTAIFIGPAGVTTTTGYPLAANAQISVPTGAAIYGVTAAGTSTVSYLDVY